MPYVKLDSGILDSTLWLSAAEVRVVFITMLAMARSDGLCEATAPGIARRANLSIETVRAALKDLEAPDDDSRSLDMEGRRIVRVDGGYFITNYEKYRQKDHTSTERSRRWRAREKAAEAQDGTTVPPSRNRPGTQAEAEAEAEAETSPNGEESPAKPTTPNNGQVPYQSILALYHEICTRLPKVQKLTPNRRTQIAARYREDLTDLDQWRSFFTRVAKTPFLNGRNDRSWRADLEWVTKQGNYAKIVEGKYDGLGNHQPETPWPGAL